MKSRRRDYFTPARRVGVGAGLPAKLDSLPPLKAFGGKPPIKAFEGKLQGNDNRPWNDSQSRQADSVQQTSRHP